eukprot:CAMPEP_0206538126 /NCGR_PEP_ID=MMETSP0325_2-20121206/7686_1 /ASSEMBLY_ACC=CAM_ASM_000347 /TAXON_ID=2866 /ORGANISM="Crypthecodinium cohnii, Strain Seligo" /LENGTH=848 /DNA_ID=CAMNT_0054035523 /DNA_START=66 /DNA_END=2611 /DNA_ORIENTATION=-
MNWLQAASDPARSGHTVWRTVSKESTESTIGDGGQAQTETASASGASGGGGSASLSMSVSMSGDLGGAGGPAGSRGLGGLGLGVAPAAMRPPNANEADLDDADDDDADSDYDGSGLGDNAGLAAQEALLILQRSSLSMTTDQQRWLVEELKYLADLVESNLVCGGTMPPVNESSRSLAGLPAKAEAAAKSARARAENNADETPFSKSSATPANTQVRNAASAEEQKPSDWHFPSVRLAEEPEEVATVVDWQIPSSIEELQDILWDWSEADLERALEKCKMPYKYSIGRNEVIKGLSRHLSKDGLRRTEIIGRCVICTACRPKRMVRLVEGQSGQRQCDDCRRKTAENPAASAASAHQSYNDASYLYGYQQQEGNSSKMSLPVSQHAPHYWQPWMNGNGVAGAMQGNQTDAQQEEMLMCPNPGCGGTGALDPSTHVATCYNCYQQWEAATPMVQGNPTVLGPPAAQNYYEMPSAISIEGVPTQNPSAGAAATAAAAAAAAPVVPPLQSPTAPVVPPIQIPTNPVLDRHFSRNPSRFDFESLCDLVLECKSAGLQSVSSRLQDVGAGAAAKSSQGREAPWEVFRGLPSRKQQKLWLLMQQGELQHFTNSQKLMFESLQQKEAQLKQLLEAQRREGTDGQHHGKLQTFFLELYLREREIQKERARIEAARLGIQQTMMLRREGAPSHNAPGNAYWGREQRKEVDHDAWAGWQQTRSQEVGTRPTPGREVRNIQGRQPPQEFSLSARDHVPTDHRGAIGQINSARESSRRDEAMNQAWKNFPTLATATAAAATASADPDNAWADEFRKQLRLKQHEKQQQLQQKQLQQLTQRLLQQQQEQEQKQLQQQQQQQ